MLIAYGAHNQQGFFRLELCLPFIWISCNIVKVEIHLNILAQIVRALDLNKIFHRSRGMLVKWRNWMIGQRDNKYPYSTQCAWWSIANQWMVRNGTMLVQLQLLRIDRSYTFHYYWIGIIFFRKLKAYVNYPLRLRMTLKNSTSSPDASFPCV